MTFAIEDEAHDERVVTAATRDEALAALHRLAALPWDAEPNRAPCTNWRQCGRLYELVEYDDAGGGLREVSRETLVEISATGVRWPEPSSPKP